MSERTCSKCGITKPETLEFFRRRGTSARGGLRPDCRDCSAKRDREHYQRTREQQVARRAEYRARTKAETSARDLAYARSERGRKVRARANSRWNTSPAGREFFRQAQSRRRAKMRGVTCDLTRAQWEQIVSDFGGRCAYCDCIPGVVTMDHVVPIDKGGPHTASNVVPACGSCNSQKFTTDVTTWFTAQPFFDPARLARVLGSMVP